MIGKPIGTFDSRTIAIELRRASPEKARSLTSLEDDSPEDKRLSDMGRKAARWVQDNWDRLKAARPDMRDLVNRAAMNWRPLFVVADCAGGTWPEQNSQGRCGSNGSACGSGHQVRTNNRH